MLLFPQKLQILGGCTQPPLLHHWVGPWDASSSDRNHLLSHLEAMLIDSNKTSHLGPEVVRGEEGLQLECPAVHFLKK